MCKQWLKGWYGRCVDESKRQRVLFLPIQTQTLQTITIVSQHAEPQTAYRAWCWSGEWFWCPWLAVAGKDPAALGLLCCEQFCTAIQAWLRPFWLLEGGSYCQWNLPSVRPKCCAKELWAESKRDSMEAHARYSAGVACSMVPQTCVLYCIIKSRMV